MIKVNRDKHTQLNLSITCRSKPHTTFVIISSLQDRQVFLYRVGEPHTHLDGYPKPLMEELGIEGPVSAAFMCEDHHIAHIVKGKDRTF